MRTLINWFNVQFAFNNKNMLEIINNLNKFDSFETINWALITSIFVLKIKPFLKKTNFKKV